MEMKIEHESDVDEVINEIDIYLSKTLQNNVHVLQVSPHLMV